VENGSILILQPTTAKTIANSKGREGIAPVVVYGARSFSFRQPTEHETKSFVCALFIFHFPPK